MGSTSGLYWISIGSLGSLWVLEWISAASLLDLLELGLDLEHPMRTRKALKKSQDPGEPNGLPEGSQVVPGGARWSKGVSRELGQEIDCRGFNTIVNIDIQ